MVSTYKTLKRKLTLAVFFFYALGFTSSLYAETAKAKNSQPVTTLQEIQVKGSASSGKTASAGTKTNTPLRDVPASIVVVPKEILELQGGTTNVDSAIRNVSGVTQSSSSNYGFFNNYLVRGLNMNFLRDGVPDATTINGYSRSLADVERIEVLKGPGSALYGSGAGGGTINLVSKEPLYTPRYSIEGTYGAFDTYRTTADITGPLVKDKAAGRFIANYENSEGFRGLSRRTFEFLPTVRVDFSDTHKLTLDFDYRDLSIVADTYGIPFLGASTTQRNGLLAVSRDKKYYTPFAHTDQRVMRYAASDEINFSDDFLLRNNFVVLDRDLDLLRNAGGTIAAGASIMTGRSLRRQSDEATDYLYQIEPVVDFETWEIHHKLLTGFEYQYHDISATRETANLANILDVYNPQVPETSLNGLRFTPNFSRDINANYEALYAQDQIDLTDQFKLRLGGRVDRFDTHIRSFLDNRTERRQDHPLSGQAGLVYRPIEQTSFYTGISNGRQAILTTESTAPVSQPEAAVQYEVGNKTSFFDDKLTFDTSWYYVTRTNFLVTIGADTFPIGKQRTEGVDFDISIKPVAGWYINANYAYQTAELINVPQAAGAISVDGNRPVGIAPNSFNLWSTYEIQNGPLKGFGFGGGMNYRDSIFQNLQNTSIIPSYVTGDLVLFYNHDWFKAQINMRNITDEGYFRNGVNSGALPGDPFGVYGTIRLTSPVKANIK